MRRALVALCFVAAACSSSRKTDDVPNLVPPPSPVEASTQALQQQISNLQTSMTELLDRLDVLNARIAKIEAAQQQPPAPVAAAAPVQPRAAAPAAKPGPIASADIAEDYRQALMLIGQGKLADARGAFQKIFDADPSGHLADNALFWIGETYYQSGDYPSAMRYYQRVINEFPDENKAPDAMLKLALAFIKTGDLGMAKRTLQDCIRKYPYSAPAATARVELQRIKY
ncbi:MAG TPA: tol-pal system protein YbgF [Thermoanaerobaculia bacterium]|nr:tol-pal system protein YbgF [Thermoanaerobaculia bacterium]